MLAEFTGFGDLQGGLVDDDPVDEGAALTTEVARPALIRCKLVVDQQGDRAVAIVVGSDTVRNSGEAPRRSIGVGRARYRVAGAEQRHKADVSIVGIR